MLVNDWMSAPAVTIGVHDTMHQATELMTQKGIGMLPVMDDGKLVGVVTDRDLKKAAPSSVSSFDIKQILYHLSRVKIEGIMTRNPVTVRPDLTIEETAQLLREHNISGCPVLDHQEEVVGVITKNDIFKALISVSGLPKRGLQFGFMVEDSPGSIKEITDIIRLYHARLVSIMTTYEKTPPGYRFLFIRTFNIDRKRLQDMMKDLNDVAKMLYMVDLRDGTRETYASY